MAKLEGPEISSSGPDLTDAERKRKVLESIPELEKQFAAYFERQKLPGMAVGIVVGEELVYSKGFGFRDLDAKAPVDADTVFRIASMTKSITGLAVLKLRDEGKLSLDDPAVKYVPELAGIHYPTHDSAPITVRQLLTHSAGLPEDNAWGDPRLDMSESEFSSMLRRGLSFSASPGIQMEYANLGFGLLGRIVQRAAGVHYQELVTRQILRPLGMTASTWDRKDVPPERLAVGYGRKTGPFQLVVADAVDPADHIEKQLADGAFASMGGLYTTIRDFARYTSFQLAAWPPRDEPEHGPVRRSSVRETQQMARFSRLSVSRTATGEIRAGAGGYGFGWGVSENCDFDRVVSHGGGLPGFGSSVSLFPDQGIALFAFTNSTYAGPAAMIIEAARTLKANGAMEKRRIAASPALTTAQAAVLELLDRWDDQRAAKLFDRTFFQYNPPDPLRSSLQGLRARHGQCRPVGVLEPENALRGKVRLSCELGQIEAAIALTADNPPTIQWVQIQGRLPPNERLLAALSRIADETRSSAQGSIDDWLAPAMDKQKTRELLTATRVRYGSCQLKRWLDGDGETFARIDLSCAREPLEARIKIDSSGRIDALDLQPARDPKGKCPR
jgi:CubicO group peptidase (beta-lactamase class C family)